MAYQQSAMHRLTEAFLTSFDWHQEGVGRIKFCDWARLERPDFIGISHHRYTAMRNGEPVPRDVIAAFSEYISDVLKLGRYPVSAISEDCSDSAPNLWQGWDATYQWVLSKFTLPEEAYIRSRDDIDCAAREVVECVGRHCDASLQGEKAITVGESVMQRSWSQYASLLKEWWRINEHSVLFPTVRVSRRKRLRVGVSVVIPLSFNAYELFRAGKLEDGDLTKGHLEHPSSPYLLLDAVSERQVTETGISASRCQKAQMSTTLYQFAALCPPIFSDAVKPIIVTFAGTPEQRKRLMAYDFALVNSVTPTTGRDIFEYPAYGERDGVSGKLFATANNFVMRAAISFCQGIIQRQSEWCERREPGRKSAGRRKRK